MRLIDAEILEDIFIKIANLTGGAQKEELIFAANMVNKMPPVDAVPVVRCRECIHHYTDEYGFLACAESGAMLNPEEDDYCSRGQRRDQFADARNMDGGDQDGQ